METVHRLTISGAVITHASTTTSDDFDAEWPIPMSSRSQEICSARCLARADFDAALARFDQPTSG
ncbi:hypothetical protein B2J96_23665 [Mycobacterium shigaense]|nr:hypothetical protein B2J96_23665 [Mycobacterium shigaense]